MKQSQQARHLTLIQGGIKIPLKPSNPSDKTSTIDNKVTRIADWNKRLETLFAKQKI